MTTTDTQDIEEQLNSVFSRFSGDGSNLIPILQETQDVLGYLPAEAMLGIAEFLRIPESSVYGVATFYAQFKLKPAGKKTIRVCRGTACHVRGADQILQEVERKLGIKPGETTDDFEYSLETVACIGACALAPTIVIDDEVQRKMTPKKVAELFSNRSKVRENDR